MLPDSSLAPTWVTISGELAVTYFYSYMKVTASPYAAVDDYRSCFNDHSVTSLWISLVAAVKSRHSEAVTAGCRGHWKVINWLSGIRRSAHWVLVHRRRSSAATPTNRLSYFTRNDHSAWRFIAPDLGAVVQTLDAVLFLRHSAGTYRGSLSWWRSSSLDDVSVISLSSRCQCHRRRRWVFIKLRTTASWRLHESVTTPVWLLNAFIQWSIDLPVLRPPFQSHTRYRIFITNK